MDVSRLIVKLIRNLPEVLRRTLFFYRSGFYTTELSRKEFDLLFQGWHMIGKTRGYMRSLLENQCVDQGGNPIPWYTYPAIEQIDKWDFLTKNVLEFGSGNSTLWWADRARSITSIESDQSWYGRIRARTPSNCTLILAPVDLNESPVTDETRYIAAIDCPGKYKSLEQLERYASVVDSLGQFDVIIIDGEASNFGRLNCTRHALTHLQADGLLIVDNSDWHPETCRYLREAGFFEIDFCGLAPLNPYASTTSIFFKSLHVTQPLALRHPGPTLGGYQWDWELRERTSR